MCRLRQFRTTNIEVSGQRLLLHSNQLLNQWSSDVECNTNDNSITIVCTTRKTNTETNNVTNFALHQFDQRWSSTSDNFRCIVNVKSLPIQWNHYFPQSAMSFPYRISKIEIFIKKGDLEFGLPSYITLLFS